MKFIELEVQERKEKGKQAGKALRREKRIPGVVYGRKTEPVSISLNSSELDKAIKKTETMEVFLKLKLDSVNYQVMLKELQTDFVNGKFLHADFLTIENDQVLDFRVPVEIFGEDSCLGIEHGGMLQILRREIDVRCTVDNLPESIKIDISGLGLGDSIHIEELEFGTDLEVNTDVNYTVVTIVAPVSEDSEDGEEAGTESEAEAEETEAAEE